MWRKTLKVLRNGKNPQNYVKVEQELQNYVILYAKTAKII